MRSVDICICCMSTFLILEKGVCLMLTRANIVPPNPRMAMAPPISELCESTTPPKVPPRSLESPRDYALSLLLNQLPHRGS
jgi:hypothetical protein